MKMFKGRSQITKMTHGLLIILLILLGIIGLIFIIPREDMRNLLGLNTTVEPTEAPTAEPTEEPTMPPPPMTGVGEEPTSDPTAEPAEPTERLTAGLTAEPTSEPTEEPLREERGVSVYSDVVLVDGVSYPLPEGTQVEEINRGRAVYLDLSSGKILWIFPVKRISFTALEACEGFGQMLVLLSKKEIIRVDRQNNLFIHRGKEIESLEGAEAFNEKEMGCVYLEDVPWEPYC